MSSARQQRPFAVVTGASSGIGFELAKVLAEEGFDLLITAEDEEIDAAQRELNQLTASVESTRLYERIEATARPLDVLCLNAGIGEGGDFARETDPRKELRLIDLHARSTVHLCKLVLRDMVARDQGRVLVTSSIASTMPGPTETEFFERAGTEETPIGESEKHGPAEVARQGFDALMAGRERVVAGSLENKAQVAAGKLTPDSVKAEMHRKQAQPVTASERNE